MLQLNIASNELRRILGEAFDKGFFGAHDLKEEVVEELLQKCQVKSETFDSGSFTISVDSIMVDSVNNRDTPEESIRPVPNMGRANITPEWVADRRNWNIVDSNS